MTTPELRQLLKRVAAEWIVGVHVDGELIATGFLVSDQGHVCTCHHGLDRELAERVTLTWRGVSFAARYQQALSRPAHDFALFQIVAQDGDDELLSAPICEDPEMDLDTLDQVVAIGFAGITDPLAPKQLRLLPGVALGVSDFDNPASKSTIEQIETLHTTGGPGMSGAPLLDLRRLRVVGYNRGKLRGVDGVGRAAPLADLEPSRGDFRRAWRAAGQRIDAAKRALYASQHRLLPLELVGPRDLEVLVREHTARALERLTGDGIYSAAVFVEREIEAEIERFLTTDDALAMILRGPSGSGKTNILAELARRCVARQAGDRDVLLVLAGSSSRADLLAQLPEQIGVEASFERLFIRADPARTVVLAVDAYNEWKHADRDSLCDILDRLIAAASAWSAPVKLIVSIRTEFMEQHLLELSSDHENLRDECWSALYRPARADGRVAPPFVEVPLLGGEGEESMCSEQARIYEYYRARGSIRDRSGAALGTCPLTPYDQLPGVVRKFVDRPLLVRQFVIAYHGREVPDFDLRSRLFQAILIPELHRVFSVKSTRELIEIFLGRLAAQLCAAGEVRASVRELTARTWYDPHLTSELLARTFILSSHEHDEAVGPAVGFSSEWLLEWYMSEFMRDELLAQKREPEQERWLEELMLGCPQATRHHLVGAFVHLFDWCLAHRRAWVPVLLRCLSRAEHDELRCNQLNRVFEFIRAHYGFTCVLPSHEQPPETLCQTLARHRAALTPRGAARILAYAEYLCEQRLVAEPARQLLAHESIWTGLDPSACADFDSIRALVNFRVRDIDGALAALQSFAAEHASERASGRAAFVRGRCLQWRRDYDAATREYQQWSERDDEYGRKCTHQVAFIRFCRHSDYLGAA
ncbi:MAG TPA: serine protease, partial [Enhygromyxa sp.]|nr:serine protease [Enhygromyxa sp.]